ncbi:ELYS protein, partial [Amia calva]|nr:ELYS protein [Amia calva]
MSGLLSSRLTDVQPSSLTQEEQLEAILSTAVETSTLGLITGCIRQWTSEEQPRSAANLRFILEWAWSKVVLTKEELDRICAPLFDSSCNFIDPQTLQLLQHCQLLLSNLSTILNCFLSEAQELTEKGLVGLVNKNVVSSLISQYARVVLWFCRSGLLPEGSDENVLQISRPFYNYPIIQNYYTSRREKLERLSRGKWCADCLLIDGLVSQCGDRIANLWKRDEGGTGQYPPPTLHALLDIFLLDTVEETSKHAIVIYLLLDVMYSFPNKSESSVESFPTAFAIPVGLVKLVQGFWLLDHNDHENSLDLLLHPATSRAMLSWQHARVIQALMCQGEHRRALRYIQMMKPATSSSSEIKLYLTVLLHNRCMVEAWALLRQHSNKLNVEELLRCMYEMCQSMGLMEELLKLPLALPEQECLEKFLQSSAGLQNQEFLMVHYLQQANYVPALQLNQALKMNLVNDRDPKIKERTNARNSILDQYGKVLPRVQRRLATERAKPYQLPSTILREVARPQPLSTVAKPAPAGNVLTRASFINNVLSKIGEVWLGKTVTPEPSPLKSLRVPELPSFTPRRQSVELPDAFVGTPITRTSKTISRILDLVVRPTTEKMPEAFSFQQTPPKQGRSWPASSPLQTSAVKASGLKNISKASELCLLQTPQVVKRARALTSTGPSFPGFTPQSILRTSQRPTPVGSPSASPGHSLTPPLRVKESRITFIEERTPKTSRWSNGIAADREINFLSTASPTLKSQPPGSWAVPAAVEDEEEEKEMVEEGGMAMEGSRPHETSQASARSADSTLEFHDAPTPEELEEEVVTLNPKLAALEHPSSAAVKASERVTPTEMQEEVLTEEEEEEQPMEQTGSDIVEQNTFSLDILSTLTRSGIRETSGAEFSLTSFTTSETVSQVTEEPLCPALAERPALETQTSEASEPDAVDSHSVVSVDDSEDSSSTESETKLEAPAELDPDSEVEILEEVCGNPREQRPSPPHLFLEEQPIPELEYMEEHPAAVLPVLAHEAVEEEEDLEVEALEEEPVSFTELQPSAPLLIPVEFSEEPELDGDLLQLDHPNAFEPMVDHEDHAAPSNFTLMLEAEDGENGLADSVLEDEHLLIVELPPSAENRTGDQNGASERVEEEEVISQEEITPEGVVDKERPEPVPETLPYVPEPIKMAIAENLLDAIKDTRSKEFAAELLESSVQPEVLVTGRKTTSLTTTTMTSESVRETIHMGCGDALVEEMRRTRGASMLVAEVPISSDQPEAEEVKQQQEEAAVKDLPAPAPSQKIDEEETLLAQMDLPVPTTPKRAGRRRKNTLDSTFPVTPRRSTRNTRDAESDEALENPEAPINSKLQTPQKSTPHKGGRRAKNAVVVEPPEDVQERDVLNDQDIPMPVTPTRRRGRPSVPCVSESAPMVPDEMALDQSEKKVPSSPSRLTRKSVTLEIPHLAKTEEKDTEIAEQETLIPRKRGRKPKNLVAAEQAKTVQSEPPRTPGRTTRSRLALVVEVPEKELPPLPEILPQDEPGLPVAEDALKNRLEEETRGEGEEAMALLVEGEVSIRDNFQDDTGADQRLSEATDNTRGPSSPTAGPSDEPPTETEVTEAAAGTAKDAPKSRKPGRRARPSRLPPPAKESFIFSPPRTRSKKTRAKKSPDSPEAPPDSQPQFVFSPPTTRTRRKMGQEISRNITEDMEQQEVQDEVPKVSEETDTRAAKPRKKRAARAPKKAVWSPPPVEVNLISPMPSPEELPRGRRKKPEEAESPLQRMNLRRNRKRLMDTIFPKPVTRRKML